ncbi:MAG: hypothetical protein BWY94_01994 [Actinobacteria bacterium ADurb.BinA094]|nr:MAG: hypothetical protein BWY94_01994 [Actinobacteria bacterium ADurb.BinA094]
MPDIGALELLIGLVLWVGIVVFTARLAAKKGYSPAVWTILAILLTWIALLIVLVLPRRTPAT